MRRKANHCFVKHFMYVLHFLHYCNIPERAGQRRVRREIISLFHYLYEYQTCKHQPTSVVQNVYTNIIQTAVTDNYTEWQENSAFLQWCRKAFRSYRKDRSPNKYYLKKFWKGFEPLQWSVSRKFRYWQVSCIIL